MLGSLSSTPPARRLKAERVELGKLLDQALPGDVVCVVRLDRLGRSLPLPHLIETVTARDARGIGFRSLSENIDTTTAGGRLVFHVFGEIEDESDQAELVTGSGAAHR